MTKATHLIKIWILDNFPPTWTKEMIRGAILERYSHLRDRLENIEIEELTKQK
jgi:hypothetical protein